MNHHDRGLSGVTRSCIDPLVLQATAEDITCFSYGDGLIEGSMSGGTGTLTLTGSPNLGANISGEGSVDFAVTDLQAAEYFLLVTDANGCQDSTEVTIIEPDSVTMQIIVNDLLCAESCDGEVNIAAFGGSGVFDYSVTDADGNEYDSEGLHSAFQDCWILFISSLVCPFPFKITDKATQA